MITLPQVANIEATLGAHMAAALPFVLAQSPQEITDTTPTAQALAEGYNFQPPPSLVREASGPQIDQTGTQSENRQYVTNVFSPHLRSHFDTTLTQIAKAENPLREFNEQGLNDVHLPDLVGAGLVTLDVATDIYKSVNAVATTMFESGRKTITLGSSWWSLKALIPRLGLYALFVNYFSSFTHTESLLLKIATSMAICAVVGEWFGSQITTAESRDYTLQKIDDSLRFFNGARMAFFNSFIGSKDQKPGEEEDRASTPS